MLQLESSLKSGCAVHGHHTREVLDTLDELTATGAAGFKQLQSLAVKQKGLAEAHAGLTGRSKKQLGGVSGQLEQVSSHR